MQEAAGIANVGAVTSKPNTSAGDAKQQGWQRRLEQSGGIGRVGGA
jgi:hypothetical protein